MKITIKDGNFGGNGKDGINFSGDIKAHLENVSASDNGGHGMFLMGDVEAEMISVDATNNEKSGIFAVSFDGIKEKFPYLLEAEDEALLEAANALRSAYPERNNDPAQIKSAIEETAIWKFVKNQHMVDWLSLATALLSLLK